jgi:hypothetical protein
MVQQPKTDLGHRIDDISSSHTICTHRLIPLNEWSARRRGCKTHNKRNRRTCFLSRNFLFFLLFSFVYVDSFDITEQVTLLTRFACGHKYAAWRSAAKCYGYVWLVWGSDCVLVCSLRLVPLGFEPAIPAIKRPQTYTLDPTVTGIGAGTPVILPYTRNFLTDT